MLGPITALLTGRASMENPSTSLNDPANWLVEALCGQPTATGLKVSRETALTYAAVWRAVSLVSGDVGKLPLVVYRRVGEGKERATDHPAFQLLRYETQEMTALTVKGTLQTHAMLEGNGYAYIYRDGAARPTDIVPLDPTQTYPVRENGVLYYVTQVAGELRRLPRTDVLHIRGFGFDGLVGYNWVAKARESLAVGLAAREYGSRFFANDARPGGTIEHPAKLSEEAAKILRESWASMQGGLANKHKVAVLEEGMKFNPFTISAEDSQLIETRKFEIREIANWFGVPAHLLSDDAKTSYSSIEAENQSYLDRCLDGWLCKWEAECRSKMLTEEEKAADSHLIEFVREALMRADLNARAAYYQKAAGGRSWMTPNEIRSKENMNPVDDEAASELKDPANILGKPEPTEAEPMPDKPMPDMKPDDEPMRAAIRKLMLDATGRMTRRLMTHARREAKHPDTFDNWLDEFTTEHWAVIGLAFEPTVAAARAARYCPESETGMADRLCREIKSRLSAVCETTTKRDFEAAIEKAAALCEAELPEWLTNLTFTTTQAKE